VIFDQAIAPQGGIEDIWALRTGAGRPAIVLLGTSTWSRPGVV
jgi:hypothetical protein